MPYKRNGHWYADIRPRKHGVPTGERIRKRLPNCQVKDTNKPEAREAERRLAKELSGEAVAEELPLLTDFLQRDYLEWARAEKAAPRLDEHHVKTICASEQFKGRRIDEVSVMQIEAYKRERRAAHSKWQRPYNLTSINNELTILSRALRLAKEAGLIKANPCRLVSWLPTVKAPFLILDRKDEPRLFAALREGPSYLEPLGRAALLTGMRLGELLSLERESFDFGRDLLFLKRTKWKDDPRKDKGLPLSPEARALFLTLCGRAKTFLFAREDGTRPELSTASNAFRRAARRAGLEMNIHDLRHTFGTRLGEVGASPYEIARLMGHADIQTSMIYVHPAGENLREVLRLAINGHPADTEQKKLVG